MQVAQMMIALQQVHPSHNLLVSHFPRGEQSSFWDGAKQKALAMHYGHSQWWLQFDSEHIKVVLLASAQPHAWVQNE